MRTWIASLAVAGAMIASAAGPAAAQDERVVYSGEQVTAFVDLLLETAPIENQRVVEIEAAATDQAAIAAHRDANAQMLEAIQASELAVELYDEMVVRARTDLRLSMQIYDELERRGEVAMLPEPEDAPEGVFESMGEPALRLVDGQAGF
jgi:hypothetical protein